MLKGLLGENHQKNGCLMQLLLCVVIIFSFSFLINSGHAYMQEEVSIRPSKCIVMPIGRILLVQRSDFLGAVKFLENEKNEKGEFSRYVYFEHEKGGWQKVKEDNIAMRKPGGFYRILGYLGLHLPVHARIKPLKLKGFELFSHPWEEYHATVYFWNYLDSPDPEVRLAPTPWRNIQEVNLSDPRILWYRYENIDQTIRTTIDRIWK